MEMRRCLSLIVVTALAMSVSVMGQRLTFTPNTIVDGTTSTLTVRCDVTATSAIYYIKLYKGSTSLAINDALEGSVTVEPPFQQRATAAGSLTPPGSAYLAVTFNAAISCNDAGDYRCEYSERGVNGLRTANQSLVATSNPGNIEMIVRPRLITYEVNNSVELECAGEVGFPVVGTWRWDVRDVTFASSWTPIRSNIQQTDDPNTGTGCQRRGRSTLSFQVQQEDDNNMYRCSFRNDLYSANFTFQVRETGSGGSAPSTGNGGTSQANVGMIVGIVLGVLAAIAVVVVLIFFFVFKKKRNSANDYDTGEGKDGRTYPDEDLHGNPVFTLPNKDKYGVDNEAMDGNLEGKDQDPGDRHRSKPRRGHHDDHPNSGEGRRHHRDRHGRDRDDGQYPNDHRYPSDPNEEPYPESRHYSSYEEDDGTDNRGYVPQEAIGSAV